MRKIQLATIDDVNKKISGTDDTKDNVVTFTSADESNPTAWKDVNVLSSNEKHSSILNKISNMFSNIRYLYKNVGGIKGLSSSSAITTQGEYALDAREKNASVDGTLANQISNLNSNLTNLKTINSNAIRFSKSNSDYETLRDVIVQEIVPLKVSYYVFYASQFDDLPRTDWAYSIICFNALGAIFVFAYKNQSNNAIYMRGMNASMQWVDDWKQLSFV